MTGERRAPLSRGRYVVGRGPAARAPSDRRLSGHHGTKAPGPRVSGRVAARDDEPEQRRSRRATAVGSRPHRNHPGPGWSEVPHTDPRTGGAAAVLMATGDRDSTARRPARTGRPVVDVGNFQCLEKLEQADRSRSSRGPSLPSVPWGVHAKDLRGGPGHASTSTTSSTPPTSCTTWCDDRSGSTVTCRRAPVEPDDVAVSERSTAVSRSAAARHRRTGTTAVVKILVFTA